MGAVPILIWCAGDSPRWAEIALRHGFLYGCRSDYRPSHKVTFADLNWQHPDLGRHLEFVRRHRPRLAVAPDVLDLSALPETLRYAEQLAQHAERVIIVPKAPGVIERLPRESWLVLGYSVPTSYGGADGFCLWEIEDRPVHLLGGSPARQLELARYLNVYSADGNAIQRAAIHGVTFDGARWVSRDPAVPAGPDLPYRAFERSCLAVRAAWERLALEAGRERLNQEG